MDSRTAAGRVLHCHKVIDKRSKTKRKKLAYKDLLSVHGNRPFGRMGRLLEAKRVEETGKT